MVKDKETFLRLLEQHKAIIITICNSYCQSKSDRDDLAQEIVFNLWKAFKNYRPDYKFTTWMYRIALNIAISFYRKERRLLQYSTYSENLILIDDNSDTTDELEGNLGLLQKFIHELNEIDKSLMLLYLDDKSYAEIAEIVGISVSNVATKIYRIKTYLRSKF